MANKTKTPRPQGPRYTHPEKREIAIGIFNGSIFTSAQIEKKDMNLFPSIFFVLMLMEKKQRDEIISGDIGVFWEYMNKASPRSINGYPMFASVRTLNKADWEDVRKMVLKLTEASKEL